MSDAESDVREVTALKFWAQSDQLPQNAFLNDTEMPFKWQPDALERSRFLAFAK